MLNFLKQTPPLSQPTHDCNWELVSKTYAPPKKDISLGNFSDTDRSVVEKVIMGVTTLLWKCTVCNNFKKEELLGSDVDTLEELMEKADEYGPQYVQRGDKTFVVMRYVPTQ